MPYGLHQLTDLITMTGVILLAAGGSQRLGRPKQALPYQGQSLLQRATNTALESGCSPVVAVLGSGAEELRSEIASLPVKVVINNSWAEGIAGSIMVGLQELLQLQPNLERVIIMVCDQPFVTAFLLQDLVQTQLTTGKKIVASAYSQTLGTPALFHQDLFPQLLSLQGHEGAKKLFKEFESEVASLPFPAGAIDIDTPQEYEDLLFNQKNEKDQI